MKKVILMLIVFSFFSCKKQDEQIVVSHDVVDKVYDKQMINDSIKRKTDSIKYSKMVEYIRTEKPKCNSFRDIYAFKISFKDTLGLDLKELSEFLLDKNKQLESGECDYPNFRDIFIYKNLNDAKKNEGNWLVMNSYTVGFSYSEFNN
jgi:hypothetical protein